VTKDARNLKPGDKVYSTAKFLTRGIVDRVFSHYLDDGKPITQWIAVESGGENGWGKEYIGPADWHLNPLAAERRALDLIHLKLQSLEKQRRKLEAIRADLLRSTGDGK